MKSIDLKDKIKHLSHIGFTQKEAVLRLKKNGFDEEEIQKEIFHFYPKITKEDIKKSFPFYSSLFIIALFSFSPILGLYFHGEKFYMIVTAILLITSFGYYKLNRICIWIWIILTSLFVLYFLASLLWKISGNSINILFSYSFIFSCLLFLSTLLLLITNVHKKNRKLNQQYPFNENQI